MPVVRPGAHFTHLGTEQANKTNKTKIFAVTGHPQPLG